jgi:signal transduction histidine kinase
MSTHTSRWMRTLLLGSPEVQPRLSPFRWEGLWERALPFTAIAVLAEASILLPPGAQSAPSAFVSLGLLLVVAGAFFLPWQRVPVWASVLVPITYTGSVLALVLATKSAVSGLGLVLLIPIVWTALFHRRWESACVVVAVVAAEIVTSYVPVASSNEVVIRRVFLWAAIGAVVSLAVHSLRERFQRAQHEASRLQNEIAVQADRDRIAERLRVSTIHRITSASLNLAGTIGQVAERSVASRIHEALGDLDRVIADLRITVYDAPEQTDARTLESDDPLVKSSTELPESTRAGTFTPYRTL